MRGAHERGAVTTELVLITPVLLLFLLFAVYAGRVAGARNDVVGAARDAARAASLVATGSLALPAAERAAEATLADQKVTCAGGPVVSADVSGFRPGGTVRVEVRCAINLADLALLGISGNRIVSAETVEVIDRYRSEP